MTIKKRSVRISGHPTSVSLEDIFWDALDQIAKEKATKLQDLITQIDQDADPNGNLSSALRIYILKHYQSKSRG